MSKPTPYGCVLGHPVHDDPHDPFYKIVHITDLAYLSAEGARGHRAAHRTGGRVDFFPDPDYTALLPSERWHWMWDVPGVGILKRTKGHDTLEAAITDADLTLRGLIRLILGEPRE